MLNIDKYSSIHVYSCTIVGYSSILRQTVKQMRHWG